MPKKLALKIFQSYGVQSLKYRFSTQQKKVNTQQQNKSSTSDSQLGKSYLQTIYKYSVSSKTPYFTLDSHHIQIIEDPLEFYINVKKGIQSACYKIGFSSLYLGTGTLERYLLKCIKKRKQAYPKMDVTMLFDYNRSHRIQNGQSSVEMLRNWASSFVYEDDALIAFNKVSSKQGVLGQISGVHHQKICVFDDQVIIGGANLSKTYFLNRKDRYMKFNHCQDFSSYLYDYLKIVAENSYQLQPGTSLKAPKNKVSLEKHFKLWNFSYRPQKYNSTFLEQEKYIDLKKQQLQYQKTRGFQQKKQKKQVTLTRNQQIAKQLGTSIQVRKQIYEKQYKQRKQNTRQRLFRATMEESIGNQLATIQSGPQEDTDLMEKGEKVYIFPFIHFPKLKQIDEPKLFSEILSIANKNNHDIKISSGYMNFTSSIIQRLTQFSQNKTNKIQLLCSAPQANSFYEGGLFKRYIPFFYRCFQIQILKKQNKFIKIKEFNNGEWSFHAKGAWIKQADNSYLTVLGSSNYNQRSLTSDTELQVYLYSSCQKFNKKLNIQWNNISQNCKQVKLQDLQKDEEIKCNAFVKFMSKIFKNYL